MERLELQPKLQRTLCYYDDPPDGTSPRYIAETESTPGQRNDPHLKLPTTIRDIRGVETHFSLEDHAFCALPKVFDDDLARSMDFNCKEDIVDRFLPEARRILMAHVTSAKQAIVFDYAVRRASRQKTPSRQVHKVHIDQSPTGAFRRASHLLDAKVMESIHDGTTEFRIINLWKPIEGPVEDHPLAFAECGSLQPIDLVAVPQVYPGYIGETYVIKYGAHQRFWYWSGMETSDVILLQCFCSSQRHKDDEALEYAQCAHGSFELREDGTETYKRASIEVRFLVVMNAKERLNSCV